MGVSRDCPIFLSTPYYLRNGKATNFKLGRYIHRVHANKSPLKIWENRERGRIQGLPNFLKYPLLSQEWVKLRTSNLADSEGLCEQKPIKNLGENGACAYTGTAQFFEYPLLSQEGIRLRTSNLAGIFTGCIRTKGL